MTFRARDITPHCPKFETVSTKSTPAHALTLHRPEVQHNKDFTTAAASPDCM